MKRTATTITQNPYIDLVDSDDDKDDDNQPDAHIFRRHQGILTISMPGTR